MRESGEWECRLESLLAHMPNFHPYFPDHGKGHVERIKQRLESDILPRLREPLSEFEWHILRRAVELHDIGMANPKTSGNPNAGYPTTEGQRRDIRDQHEELSRDFVMENWSQICIRDRATAHVIARLCFSHRRKHYVRTFFNRELEQIGGERVRVQLLASLLKLADTLDADFRRAPEISTAFFLTVPPEDRWHWYASQCISGISFTSSAICLEVLAAPIDDSVGDIAEVEKLVEKKALDIFSELFAVLPFTVPAGLPWVMVEALIPRQNPGREPIPIWEKWWLSELRAADVQYRDKVSIAAELCGRIRPTMESHDILDALEGIENAGYSVPPRIEIPLRPWPTYYPISSDECKKSFLAVLREANERIELLASDGLTFPSEVYDILAGKLLSAPSVKVTVFLLDADVLYEIEGKKENLTRQTARTKLNQAEAKWHKWLQGLLGDAPATKKQEVTDSFQIIFVRSVELALLNGSAIIDDRILRLNVHGWGESSSRGMMLHCPEPVNLLSVVRHYVHDLRRFGQKWVPGEDDIEETTK